MLGGLLVLAVVGGVAVKAYLMGADAAEAEYNELLLKEKEEARERFMAAQRRDNEEVAGYVKAMAEMERKHREEMDELASADLRDTVPAPAAPCRRVQRAEGSPARVPAPRAEPGVECYRGADLRRKVAESLALGRECDALALRYNTLLKVCGERR